MSSSCSSVAKTPNGGSWLSSPSMGVSHHLFPDAREDKMKLSGWPVLSGFSNPQLNQDSTFDPIEKVNRSETAASCRLFGIELINHSASTTPLERTPEKNSTMTMDITDIRDLSTLSSTDSDQKSNLSKESKEKQQEWLQLSAKEIQSRQNCSSFTRSRTKVQMQGIAVGRAVDLSTFEGYDQLIEELEEMFDIRGELRPRNKWEIVYTDDEGDMMLVGDDPWPEFCNMVRRILICSSQDVRKMSKRSKLPLACIEGEGTVISSDLSEN
ncbi:hypothetical protein V6N13_035096 [Hibiscus sabdariffa]